MSEFAEVVTKVDGGFRTRGVWIPEGGGDGGPHDHDEFAEIQAKQDEQDARLDALPDATEYRYHHASMWYEVAGMPGESWWSDSNKFMCNPTDLDGQTTASTFVQEKLLGCTLRRRTALPKSLTLSS